MGAKQTPFKMIQANPYTICSSHQLKNQSGALYLLFPLFYTIKTLHGTFTVLGDFKNLRIRSQKEPHKISLSEPTVLFMQFTSRVDRIVLAKTLVLRVLRNVCMTWTVKSKLE